MEVSPRLEMERRELEDVSLILKREEVEERGVVPMEKLDWMEVLDTLSQAVPVKVKSGEFTRVLPAEATVEETMERSFVMRAMLPEEVRRF
jgi:hypothetical protein